MVTCNICGMLKDLESMNPKFRYVCKDCWKQLRITLDGVKIDKDLIY